MKEKGLFVAGVGASAGGIEALQKLLYNLPEEPLPLAFIITQHLNPQIDSNIHQILQRATKWKVDTVAGQNEILPNTIYITPPGYDLLVKNEKLILSNQSEGKPKPSINRFFFHWPANLKITLSELYSLALVTMVAKGCETFLKWEEKLSCRIRKPLKAVECLNLPLLSDMT